MPKAKPKAKPRKAIQGAALARLYDTSFALASHADCGTARDKNGEAKGEAIFGNSASPFFHIQGRSGKRRESQGTIKVRAGFSLITEAENRFSLTNSQKRGIRFRFINQKRKEAARLSIIEKNIESHYNGLCKKPQSPEMRETVAFWLGELTQARHNAREARKHLKLAKKESRFPQTIELADPKVADPKGAKISPAHKRALRLSVDRQKREARRLSKRLHDRLVKASGISYMARLVQAISPEAAQARIEKPLDQALVASRREAAKLEARKGRRAEAAKAAYRNRLEAKSLEAMKPVYGLLAIHGIVVSGDMPVTDRIVKMRDADKPKSAEHEKDCAASGVSAHLLSVNGLSGLWRDIASRRRRLNWLPTPVKGK